MGLYFVFLINFVHRDRLNAYAIDWITKQHKHMGFDTWVNYAIDFISIKIPI